MNRRPRLLTWLLLAIWMTWVTALQSRLAESPSYRFPPPDLNLVFLISLALVVRRANLIPLALIAGLARTSFSLDPPQALFFLTLVVGAVAVGSRRALHLEGPIWRALLSGFAAIFALLWLSRVRSLRGLDVMPTDLVAALVLAISSALSALVLGGLFLRLPGLHALRGSKR